MLFPANWSLLIGPCSLQARSCPLGYLIGCHISQRSAALCLCLVQAVVFPSVDSGLHACRLALQRSVLQMYKGYCCSISSLVHSLSNLNYSFIPLSEHLHHLLHCLLPKLLQPSITAVLQSRDSRHVLQTRRAFLRLPMPLLPTCSRSLRSIRAKRPHGAGEDRFGGIRLFSTWDCEALSWF